MSSPLPSGIGSMGPSIPADFTPSEVVLVCTDPNHISEPDTNTVTISTEDVNNWDFSSILCHQIIKIKANRTRLTEQSSYFRGLLSGSFSESTLSFISIQWNQQTFLSLLTFIFGYPVDVTSINFLPMYEAALFWAWICFSSFVRGGWWR